MLLRKCGLLVGLSLPDPSWKIQPGERVVLDGARKLYSFELQTGKEQGTRVGNIKHEDIMKAGYGTRLLFPGKAKKHSFVIRRPSFDLFVKRLKRQCTPSYPKDFGAIGNQLDLKPGMKILEAGSGTGMLSLYIESRIQPTGELWSYELRPDFHKEAVKNAKKWHPNTQVKFHLGDVTTVEAPDGYFDGMMLDMMTPWELVGKLLPKLKDAANVVFVQPNITQILELKKTIKDQNLPLLPVRVMEVMERDWAVEGFKSHPIMAGQALDVSISHTCFLTHFVKGGNEYLLPERPPKVRSEAALEDEDVDIDAADDKEDEEKPEK